MQKLVRFEASFNSGGSVVAGAAVVDGAVYWGSRYRRLDPSTTPNNKLYGFTVSKSRNSYFCQPALVSRLHPSAITW
jgi:hypothetical protein